jgi:tyrosyl-tRNA synthetase
MMVKELIAELQKLDGELQIRPRAGGGWETAGMTIAQLFERVGLTQSVSEARRLIQQGGAYVNEQRVSDADAIVAEADIRGGQILLRRGKKSYHRVVVTE